LRQLSRRGALVVATTHYGELKHFALSAQRFENASVEFDPRTLRPTYHLRIGVPGASNALDIALQLGLAPELVTRARRYLGTDRVEAEAAAQRLEETQRELQSQTEEARRSREGGEELQREFERRLAVLEAEKLREIESARKEARRLVDEAQHEADAALRSLRQAAHHGARENKGTEEARHRLRTLRERLGPAEVKKPTLLVARTLARPERPRPPQNDVPLAVGQWVHLRTLGREGEIVQLEGNRAQVRVGAMKVEAKVSDLEAARAPSDTAGAVSGLRTRKSWGVAPEIHLLGKNGEEAIGELEKYLDDAVVAGLGEVRVIHGRGTGALRTAIHRWLKVQGSVSAFELAPQGEGGEGATVVHLG
jgi:DNA mismatch repair protein MutS2